MRIVQLMHSHGWGGAEQHLVQLATEQATRGHEVIFAGPHDSWLRENLAPAGVHTEHLRMSGLLDPFSHWRLRALVRDFAPDVVHAHGVRASFYAGLAIGAHRDGVAIATAHSTGTRGHMRGCAQVIAVSHAVRRQLLAHGHAAGETPVVYNGVADMVTGLPRQRLRRSLGIAPGEFALCSAGRFIHDKGQDLMVEALAQVRGPVVLCLFGDEGTEFGRHVGQLAKGDPRIRFMGFRDDARNMLPAFDAYLCASRREAFGLSLAEASAASLPVIAPDVGGIAEVIRHGESGWLVPSENPLALAEAINLLRGDGTLASALGRGGRQRYLEHFTVNRMVDETLDVYRDALSERAEADTGELAAVEAA
ncbi:glycosyltransferase family 4 protein [soil metagenome]